MIFKHTLLPLLAVALQQFANAVPLDSPGQQHDNSLEQLRPAEVCDYKQLPCNGPLGSYCNDRLFICIYTVNVGFPQGVCTKCNGKWIPERIFTADEAYTYLITGKAPDYP